MKTTCDNYRRLQLLSSLTRSDYAAHVNLDGGFHAFVMRLFRHYGFLTQMGGNNYEMKTGRGIAERLIAAHPNMGDAYLAVGVENYVLSQKAAPVRWLLRPGGAQTDYERGVQNVSLTAERGYYLALYARVLLAVAALRENNTVDAKTLLQELVAEYPHNELYRQELARLH